jgi:pilus assembly protein CpaB
MRGRTLVLFAIAVLLAGGTALLVRSWLAQRQVVAAVAPPPPPQKSLLVARLPIARGQLLTAADFAAQPWPDNAISGDYVLAGTAAAQSLTGSVAREPFAAGEPISRSKLVAPGERGFLAAVLHTGMRAVSVPVDVTGDVSGFVFPGDRVDVLLTFSLPAQSVNDAGYQHKAAQTVLRDVRVIAIDQRVDTKNSQAVLARTVTLEVTPKQSEVLTLAADMPGKLSLCLRALAAPPEYRSGAPSFASLSADDLVLPARSDDGRGDRGFALDTELSPLLRHPIKHNFGDREVCVLRGTGGSSNGCESQPASRGS